MLYLLSVHPEKTKEDEDIWAPSDEPVVPWYPATMVNVFLSVTSFKQAPYARIVDVPDLDLGGLADRLAKEYPGLPGTLHENYVLATAKLAHMFPIGTKFQIFINYDTAKVKVIGQEELHVMWSKQPL